MITKIPSKSLEFLAEGDLFGWRPFKEGYSDETYYFISNGASSSVISAKQFDDFYAITATKIEDLAEHEFEENKSYYVSLSGTGLTGHVQLTEVSGRALRGMGNLEGRAVYIDN